MCSGGGDLPQTERQGAEVFRLVEEVRRDGRRRGPPDSQLEDDNRRLKQLLTAPDPGQGDAPGCLGEKRLLAEVVDDTGTAG
jgi:hypothetical protein